MKGRFAGSRELGVARFSYLWARARTQWDILQPWIGSYLAAWEAEAPDDPYLAWGRYEAILHRALEDRGRPLSSRDRVALVRMAERFRGDALWAHATSLLADDAVACGEGELALNRYREVAGCDPSSARLPAPRHADVVVGWARGRLAVYYEYRDPTKLAEWIDARTGRADPFQEHSFCGNALADSGRDGLRNRVRRWQLVGRTEAVLEEYEFALYRGWPGLAPGYTMDYVEACRSTGKMD